jgi:hypothetical protein
MTKSLERSTTNVSAPVNAVEWEERDAPSPTLEGLRTDVAGDGAGEDSSERSRGSGSGVVNGESSTHLVLLVPGREKEENSRAETGLDYTEDGTNDGEGLVRVAAGHGDGDTTPDKPASKAKGKRCQTMLDGARRGGSDSHDSGKVDRGSDSSEDHVGRNFSADVADEEDEEDDRILVGGEGEVLLHSSRLGVTDVGPGKRRKKG